MVYQPAEDSYLLQKQLINYIKNLDNKNIKLVDMGSGSGIQALTAIKQGIANKNVLAVDINKKAIKQLKKHNLKTKQSNLFSNIDKKQRFNLIVFNPPYLPSSKYDKQLDTTAGQKGYELIIKFLKQAKQYLSKDGKILLLFSNLSKPNIIKQNAKKLNYNYKKLIEKNIFFEKLYVYEFSQT